jgi:hypothetical protein
MSTGNCAFAASVLTLACEVARNKDQGVHIRSAEHDQTSRSREGCRQSRGYVALAVSQLEVSELRKRTM